MKRIDKFNHMQSVLEEIFKEDHKAEIEKQAKYWSEVDEAYEKRINDLIASDDED